MKRLILCLVSVFFFTGCQCTLHTHYFNDHGECVCGYDKSIDLLYENNEYNAIKHQVEEQQIYYYKIETHGETGLDFILNTTETSEEILFDRLEIRGPGIVANDVAGNKYQTNLDKVYTSSRTYQSNTTYYLKITYKGVGTVQLKVINSIQ